MTDLITYQEISVLTPPKPVLASSISEVDFSRPLGELVNAAVIAAGRSSHTRRAYRQSIGQFLIYCQLADAMYQHFAADCASDLRQNVPLFRLRLNAPIVINPPL